MATLNGTLPVSRIVNIIPSALGAGLGVNFINGLILSQNSIVPAGTVVEYTSADDVAKAFTPTSTEAQMAAAYFAGFTGTRSLPSKLYFYGVPQSAAGGGGSGTAQPQALTLDVIMNQVIDLTQDFAGFSAAYTLTKDDMTAGATWTDEQNGRYWFVPSDTDAQALVGTDSTSFGATLVAQKYSGTTPVWNADAVQAAVAAGGCLGWMAALNFELTNGRATLADRQNPQVTPAILTSAQADALEGNGYTYMGAFANGLGRWQTFRQGAVSGQFLWADSYICQIWLSASLQANFMNLLMTQGQIPYTRMGDALMSAAVLDSIQQAMNFGVIRAGVQLSNEQILTINNQSGVSTAASTVQQRGWYFQPNASTTAPDIRVQRKSPACTLWYADGQSIQTINLASIEVQ